MTNRRYPSEENLNKLSNNNSSLNPRISILGLLSTKKEFVEKMILRDKVLFNLPIRRGTIETPE